MKFLFYVWLILYDNSHTLKYLWLLNENNLKKNPSKNAQKTNKKSSICMTISTGSTHNMLSFSTARTFPSKYSKTAQRRSFILLKNQSFYKTWKIIREKKNIKRIHLTRKMIEKKLHLISCQASSEIKMRDKMKNLWSWLKMPFTIKFF